MPSSDEDKKELIHLSFNLSLVKLGTKSTLKKNNNKKIVKEEKKKKRNQIPQSVVSPPNRIHF